MIIFFYILSIVVGNYKKNQLIFVGPNGENMFVQILFSYLLYLVIVREYSRFIYILTVL